MTKSLYFNNRAALFARYGETANKIRRYTFPGSELTTDAFYFGTRMHDKVIVVISGTHGLEGPAGSYIQLRLADKIYSMQDSGVGVLLINALNPWGYRHGRRVDAKNIDVNRAGGTEFITRSGYANVHQLVAPSVWNEEYIRARFADHAAARQLQAAVMGGQYDHPDGLFYGGSKGSCWSIETLEEIVKDFFRTDLNLWANDQFVAIIDIHTGLGTYGQGDIYSPSRDPNSSLAVRTRKWIGDSVQFPLIQGAESSSTEVSGDILSHLIRIFKYIVATPVAVEMGTQWSTEEMIVALAAENWVYHHPGSLSGAQERAIRLRLQEGFFPAGDQKWLEAMWDRCLSVFEACEAGLIGQYESLPWSFSRW